MRVLVVEDMVELAEEIADGLRGEGMSVDVAFDGGEAIAKMGLVAYDVTVLDRDLPGVHGDDVCRAVADMEHSPMVLMLTASASPGDRVGGLSAGADDYLVKPFHFPELVLRIRTLARRHPRVQPRRLRASGLELDPITRTTRRDGRALDLSPKEFAVLEALLRAMPASLTAEDLLEKVWDENADPFTNTVPVTVGRLRRKLGSPMIIETVPGAGYRISGADCEEPDD